MSLPRVDASGGDSSYGGSPAVATYCKQARVHGLIALCQHAHAGWGGICKTVLQLKQSVL